MTDEQQSSESGNPSTTDGAANTEPPAGGRIDALRSRVRFGKFVSVGVFGAACDTAVLFTLNQVIGLPAEVATIIGIETAILVMFAINEHWTFAGEGTVGRGPLAGRLLRSHGVRAAGSVTQFVVFVAILWNVDATIPVGAYDLWVLVPKAAGIAVGMVVNYVFESLFTWQVHR